jgi:hypothetical protein
MADGLGNQGPDMSGFWQAQAELGKQISRVSEILGSVTAHLADRVTHKDMMNEFSGFRKEVGGKLDHMEGKFDQSTSKVEAILDRATQRQFESWRAIADEAVSKEMIKRDAQEVKAREAVQRSDAELERKIRQANRNGLLGGGAGLLGIAVAIYQSMYGG